MTMKRIAFIAAAAAAMLLAGCENAEYSPKGNIIYFDAAASGEKSQMVTLEGASVDLPMLVRLAQKAEQDVEVQIVFDPAQIDEFNSLNGTDYLPVPESALPSEGKITIPKGEVGVTYNLHVSSFESDGATYAVPVRIASSSASDIPVSSVQSKFVYVLTIPLSVTVPTMRPSSSSPILAEPTSEWGIEVEDWTIETWVKMDGFRKNNQALFTSGNSDKGCEIYVRFGDANRPFNYLQAKIMGNNDISTDRDWEANRWYHVAIVCTKADSKVAIYRDGVKIKEAGVTYPSDGKCKIDQFQMISSGNMWFVNNCSMGQVKLWKVARTPKEITDNMYFSVNPQNPNLIGYWPLDKNINVDEGGVPNESEVIFEDITGNGHNAVCPWGMVNSWTDNVNFKN